MNYFYGIKYKKIQCNITIPKFQNRTNLKPTNFFFLYELKIKKNKWLVSKVKCEEDRNFYFVHNNKIDNHIIYFLSNEKEIEKMRQNNFCELVDLNDFTDTDPPYRANLSIMFSKKKGHSSFQSEYPYNMTLSSSGSVSSLFVLTNKKAQKNYVFLRNIFHKPIFEKFPLYFINLKKKKIIKKFSLTTNMTNVIEIEKKFLNHDNFLYTKNFSCLPMYVSFLKNHLSFEHTHPPHEYILSKDRFSRVLEFKKIFNEITY